MNVMFDDSLPKLCEVAARHLRENLLTSSVVIREAAGRLSLIVAAELEPSVLAALDSELRTELGQYARPDRVVSDVRSPSSQKLLDEAMSLPAIAVGGRRIHVLDRRIVGADWLRSPGTNSSKIPRIVFSSLKGGVGRSTALCVAASHLSQRGRRVLAIDFDLEAPGIGTMLLRENELSAFGSLDYFVESALSNVDDSFFTELSGDSFLGASGARVTVVPAIGTRTIENPANALAKIARAYLEVPQENRAPKSLTEQFADMLANFEDKGAYDVILIDSRAGLHETAAAVILGIGAEVLLFGIDQPQTFQSYRLLLGHLARFPADSSDDWRERLCFVQAKAPESETERAEAASRFKSLYEPLLKKSSVVAIPENLTAKDFDLDWKDDVSIDVGGDEFEAPPVLHVLEDNRFRRFDPVADRNILDSPLYASSFGALLDYVDSIVGLDDPEDIDDRHLPDAGKG